MSSDSRGRWRGNFHVARISLGVTFIGAIVIFSELLSIGLLSSPLVPKQFDPANPFGWPAPVMTVIYVVVLLSACFTVGQMIWGMLRAIISFVRWSATRVRRLAKQPIKEMPSEVETDEPVLATEGVQIAEESLVTAKSSVLNQ